MFVALFRFCLYALNHTYICAQFNEPGICIHPQSHRHSEDTEHFHLPPLICWEPWATLPSLYCQLQVTADLLSPCRLACVS